MFSHFLVAVDASPEAAAVIEAAGELARATSATVEVLHVQESFVGEVGVADLESDSEAHLVAERHAERLRAAGVTATVRVVSEVGRHGGTAEVIAEHARRHRADLILIGRSHHGALMRLVAGSVTTGIFRDAPCSLLVVRDLTSPPGQPKPG